MRLTLRDLALLALPTLSNAVSLADMTPRATGLPPQCEAVYTSQIYGCAPSDFQSNQCSSSCINGLYGIAAAIGRACGGQGVTGQNLVVAFLAGVGPQQLCHNARNGGQQSAPPSPPPRGPPTTDWASIVSSTTTARTPSNTKSLLVDTSSTMTATIIPKPTKPTHTSESSSSEATSTTTTRPSPTPTHNPAPIADQSSTTTTSAAGSSQTDLNDHSGGGSPFDSEGNMSSGAAASSISTLWTILSAAAMLMALR